MNAPHANNAVSEKGKNQSFKLPRRVSDEKIADFMFEADKRDRQFLSRKPDYTEKLCRRLSAERERFPGQPGELNSYEREVAQVGAPVARDAFVDQVSQRRILKEQSDALIERLERNGISGRQDRKLSYVDMITGDVERITDYRNTNFIPVVQSRNVHDMMQHVEYFCTKQKENTLRMLVISGGWVAFDGYRAHHLAHTRRMSKYRYEVRKRFGVELAYYNVENTIHRNDGVAQLNMHSHALLHVPRRLSRERWEAFLAYTRNFFPKGYVHDSKIAKAKEVVKYVFKPSEFECLTDNEFTELFTQITGGREKCDPLTGETETRVNDDGEIVPVLEGPLKFFHPLGQMKKFRASLKRQGRKLIRHYNYVTQKHEWRTTERRQSKDHCRSNGEGRTKNIALAVTAPLPYFSERRRPIIVVENYDGNFDHLIKSNDLKDGQARVAAIYAARVEAEREASFMKHTTTTTVPDRTLRSSQIIDPDPPNSRYCAEC